MSLNNARISLFTYLDTNWTTTPLVFEGEDIGDEYIKKTSPWIFAYLGWGDTFQKSAGAPDMYFLTTGILSIRIFIRHGDGIALKDQYTDEIFSLFRAKTIDNMLFHHLGIGRDKNTDEWQTRELSLSFDLRTIETIS